MLAPVFRQHHDAPDFSNALANFKPATSGNWINIIQCQNVMTVLTIISIDLGIKRNLVLTHHRSHAHIVGTSPFAFFCNANNFHEYDRLVFFRNTHKSHGAFPGFLIFETVALASTVAGMRKFFYKRFPAFELAIFHKGI